MEEEFKPIICTICLNVKNGENCRGIDESIKNALDVLLLNMCVEEANKSMVCNACCTSVFEAFRFKTACTNTEFTIFPHLNSTNEAPVDLKKIYLMENCKEQLRKLSEEEEICRLCMQIVTSGFTPVQDIEIDLIHIYIPEVNFNSTEGPVLCTSCLESLKKHGGFLKNCLGIQKLENVSENEPMKGKFDIKTEEIEIKSEESNETETHLPADEPTVCEPEDGQNAQLFKEGYYKCSACAYQSTRRFNIIRHRLKHKNLSEALSYKCDVCDYVTKRKRNLIYHQLTHKDVSEIPMYKCDICTYKTRYKAVLVRHQQRHELSIAQMYKCDTCNYETKRKGRLLHHQLKHKNVCEVQVYKCDTCNFETRHKENLTRHGLIHKDVSEVQMYRCGTCNFETKHRANLVNHELKHKDISEVQMYKCDMCNYETVHRNNVLQHRITHADIFEVQMYKCDVCNFETKRKGSLKRHALKHKNNSNVQL